MNFKFKGTGSFIWSDPTSKGGTTAEKYRLKVLSDQEFLMSMFIILKSVYFNCSYFIQKVACAFLLKENKENVNIFT